MAFNKGLLLLLGSLLSSTNSTCWASVCSPTIEPAAYNGCLIGVIVKGVALGFGRPSQVPFSSAEELCARLYQGDDLSVGICVNAADHPGGTFFESLKPQSYNDYVRFQTVNEQAIQIVAEALSRSDFRK